MFKIPLIHPIHTLDGKELVPRGVTLTWDVVRKVVASGGGSRPTRKPLIGFGSVRKDISQFFANPPYKTIFANHERAGDIRNVMEQVVLPREVLEALAYFRESDFYTYRHALMVFALSTLLGMLLIHDHNMRITYATAGPSHDLGKICVPLDILSKSDPLTRAERNILFQHTAAGYVLLCYYNRDVTDYAARVARDHHEFRDGSGYMRGVKLNDPMVEIVAVCDIYDGLLSPRPYRTAAYDNRTALEELTAMAQRGQIGWHVVQALVSLNRKVRQDFRTLEISREKRGTVTVHNPCTKPADIRH